MKKKMGIVTFPIGDASIAPLTNFVDIFDSISDNLCIITGNSGSAICNVSDKCTIYLITHKEGHNLFTRIFFYALTQIKISFQFLTIAKKADIWIFPIFADSLLLPMLIAKLLGKTTILCLPSSAEKTMRIKKDKLGIIIIYFAKINYYLSDGIILYSSRLIKEWNLRKYKDKIYIAHKHFLNFEKFYITNKLNERKNLVGFIGRFSQEKGIINFIESIPLLLEHNLMELNFFIGGDGNLGTYIEKYIYTNKLYDNVEFSAWIDHNLLPEYLNKLKLLVLPSYTEGLPNILLEAMACGTPVLTTSVDAIPDIIKDKETGFIMENNSPECIARNVIQALENPNLENIVNNAKALVEKEFTFEVVVGKYNNIFEKLYRHNTIS